MALVLNSINFLDKSFLFKRSFKNRGSTSSNSHRFEKPLSFNKFLKEFKDRGFFYQCTNENELSDLLSQKKIKAYIGFDCTAESLHVGSLLQIMCLRLLQKHGHQPIVLLGGGTTRIGDPSGKDKTRKILDENEIERNTKNIKNILKNLIIKNCIMS